MSFLSGLLRTVAPLALAALTGGAAAPLMAMAMKTIGSEILKMVVDFVGQQLGSAFSDINRAQSSIEDRFGTRGQTAQRAIEQFGEAVGASPFDIGQMQNQFDLVAQTLKDNMKSAFDNMSPARKEKLKGKGGLSWLQVMADAMSKILDASLAKLDQKSTALVDTIKAGKGLKGDAVKDNSADTQKAQTDFTVASQEFSILMNSVNTALKTVGEGLTTMARKQ
jgi:hypothetical protein